MVWNTYFVNPLVNALLFLYGVLGNYGVSIILLTTLVRVATYPLTARQLQSAKKMQALQPQLDKLRKKYEGDKEKFASKQMELFRENGVNPAGGCVPMLIQFPLLIGFYQALTQSLAVSPLQMVNLSQRVYDKLPMLNISDLVPVQGQFLWLDLGATDTLFIIPIIVVVTSFLQTRLTATPSADSQQQSMQQSMQWTMPLMIGYFALIMPSGVSLYYATSNVLGIVQSALTGRMPSVNKLLGRETEEPPKIIEGKKSSSKSKSKKKK